jgi:hypothetical protein
VHRYVRRTASEFDAVASRLAVLFLFVRQINPIDVELTVTHFFKRRLVRALCALSPAIILAACTPDATAPSGAASGVAPGMITRSSTLLSTAEPMYAPGTAPLIWQDTFDSVSTDAAMLSKYATSSANYMHLDATGGIGGSHAARIDWKASTTCSDASRVLEKDFAQPANEIYVQYSVRYTAGAAFDWSGRTKCTGNAKNLMLLWPGSGALFSFTSENHVLGAGSTNDHPLFAQNTNTAVTDEMLGDGNWHRITLHVKQSSTPTTADGVIEGWIDGVQRWSMQNVASNASGGWTLMKMPASFNSGSPLTQSEWLDGLTVWGPVTVVPSPIIVPPPLPTPTPTPAPTPPVTPVAPPSISGSEPSYASGVNTLLWQDSFDAKGTDAGMLAPYATMNNETGIHFDASAGLNGSGAARIDWTAQNSTNCLDQSHLMEKSFTPSQEVYVQYSVRYQPGFLFDWTNLQGGLGCTGNAKKIMFLWAASGSRFDFISENHWLGMGSDYDHPLFNQNVGPVVSDEMLADGNWHRFTIHVRQSSTPTAPDGLIEGWIDGVQRWSWPNVASNASGGWVLMKVPTTFNSGSPVNQSEWMDGLTIWKP